MPLAWMRFALPPVCYGAAFSYALVFLAIGGSHSAAAQAPSRVSRCRFPERHDRPLGYRLRDNRCEGVYREDPQFHAEHQFNSASVALLSLTRVVDAFNPAVIDTLSLRWRARASSQVILTVTGLRRGLYYRMDTALESAGSGTFRWDGELLRLLHLQPEELGAVASVPYSFAGFADTLRLPLDVRARDGPVSSSSRYNVVLLLREEPRALFITLSPLTSSNTIGAPLLDHQSAEFRPGHSPNVARLVVPFPSAAGVYYLEVEARLWDGRRVSAGYLIYHSAA